MQERKENFSYVILNILQRHKRKKCIYQTRPGCSEKGAIKGQENKLANKKYNIVKFKNSAVS